MNQAVWVIRAQVAPLPVSNQYQNNEHTRCQLHVPVIRSFHTYSAQIGFSSNKMKQVDEVVAGSQPVTILNTNMKTGTFPLRAEGKTCYAFTPIKNIVVTG